MARAARRLSPTLSFQSWHLDAFYTAESGHARDAACTAAHIGVSHPFCDGCTCAAGYDAKSN
jgi:hypothetical protein